MQLVSSEPPDAISRVAARQYAVCDTLKSATFSVSGLQVRVIGRVNDGLDDDTNGSFIMSPSAVTQFSLPTSGGHPALPTAGQPIVIYFDIGIGKVNATVDPIYDDLSINCTSFDLFGPVQSADMGSSSAFAGAGFQTQAYPRIAFFPGGLYQCTGSATDPNTGARVAVFPTPNQSLVVSSAGGTANIQFKP